MGGRAVVRIGVGGHNVRYIEMCEDIIIQRKYNIYIIFHQTNGVSEEHSLCPNVIVFTDTCRVVLFGCDVLFFDVE